MISISSSGGSGTSSIRDDFAGREKKSPQVSGTADAGDCDLRGEETACERDNVRERGEFVATLSEVVAS